MWTVEAIARLTVGVVERRKVRFTAVPQAQSRFNDSYNGQGSVRCPKAPRSAVAAL
jgi:hypothetical protein